MIKSIGLTNPVDSVAGNTVKRQPVYQSILLHLLPGGLMTFAFLLLAPWLHRHNLPHLLAFLIPLAAILIPVELGVLFYSGLRWNKRVSLEGIVLNNNPLKSKDLPAAILLFVWAALVFTALGRLDGAILNRLFMWVPDWLQANQFAVGGYSQPVRTTTFVLFLFLNGVAGPIVEELYFRGYLMPRLGRLRGWAPLINTILFSIYHFFSPWGNLSRVLAFFPMVWVVDRKKSIYIGILAHCLLNIGYCLQKAPLFF